jgi:hypothetical protein
MHCGCPMATGLGRWSLTQVRFLTSAAARGHIIAQDGGVASDGVRLMRRRRWRGALASSASIASNSFSMARAETHLPQSGHGLRSLPPPIFSRMPPPPPLASAHSRASGVQSSCTLKASVHIQRCPTCTAAAVMMRPTTAPLASTPRSSSFDLARMGAKLRRACRYGLPCDVSIFRHNGLAAGRHSNRFPSNLPDRSGL